jgi:hypothetical protein
LPGSSGRRWVCSSATICFARFLGYADETAFGDALTAEARRVQGHYALLFEAEPG